MTSPVDSPLKMPTRRQLIQMIGAAAGSSTAYAAMAALDVASPSTFTDPVKLRGQAPKGSTVLILGAGIAGMVAAYELRAVGYKVQVLEYNNRAGGRNWTIRGGDRFTELGGIEQHCQFEKDLYINPGPWRIPFHHRGLLHYCRELGVELEPFNQVNYNAYVHNTKTFGGVPQRYRHIQADYEGNIAELLSKATAQHKLDDMLSKEDLDVLLESLRSWGALDRNMAYAPGPQSSDRRGYEKFPGGGLTAAPEFSKPMNFHDLLQSRAWSSIGTGRGSSHHQTIFQPTGGMGTIGFKFGKELGPLIKYNTKVTSIHQDSNKVTVTYVDSVKGGVTQTATADWCVCTIPLSVLSQIDITVGKPMQEAIEAVPYSANTKVGLQFKRRFWEEDEAIYGGITYTNLPISQIAYPNSKYNSKGKGVLLGAYMGGKTGFLYAAMTPKERVAAALADGAKIHPQYMKEFDNGVAVAWHRVPWTLGCAGAWTSEGRAKHYNNLCAIDGRIVLAGEHASYIPAWQEGAVTSSLDAITRLHERIIAA